MLLHANELGAYVKMLKAVVFLSTMHGILHTCSFIMMLFFCTVVNKVT